MLTQPVEAGDARSSCFEIVGAHMRNQQGSRKGFAGGEWRTLLSKRPACFPLQRF